MIADKYKNRYYINNDNLYNTYGVIIERGGYNELMKEPKRKNMYSYVWLDENGTERFINDKYETRNVTLNFIFLCETLEDYLTKSNALFELLRMGYVTIQSSTLNKEWQLLYDSETNVENLTDIYSGGMAIVKHTLTFFDDNVFPTPFTPLII